MKQPTQDPISLAAEAIRNARTSAILEESKKSGRSKEDTSRILLGDTERLSEMGKTIKIVHLLNQMGDLFDLSMSPGDPIIRNRAFLGYAQIMRHYLHEPQALAFCRFYKDATKVRHVWHFFTECNGIAPSRLLMKEGFSDPSFVQDLLNRDILTCPGFVGQYDPS